MHYPQHPHCRCPACAELLVVVAHDGDEHEIRKMIPAGLPDDVIALVAKGLLYENDWVGVAYETFIGGVRQ